MSKNPRSRDAVAGNAGAADTLLASDYDSIVRQIYRAGAEIEPWFVSLNHIAEATAASTVCLGGFDRRTGAVIFGHWGGRCPSGVAAEYLAKYHEIDPRLALIMNWPVGKWLACQEHFDDSFVARDPFYQDYLLPCGSRYVYGAKVWENDAVAVVLAHHRPQRNPLIDPVERNALRRLAAHIASALEMQYGSSGVDRDELGYAALRLLHHPVILLDRDRRIIFHNEAAQAILNRADVLWNRQGMLVCHHAASDVAMAQAVRALSVSPANSQTPDRFSEQRRTLRLWCADDGRIVIALLLALRPGPDAGNTDHQSRVLLMTHEPNATELTASLLMSAFNFTPAEARVAARLGSGHTVEEIATEYGIAITTVRTQLAAIFAKTNCNRQANLVRLLVAATAI